MCSKEHTTYTHIHYISLFLTHTLRFWLGSSTHRVNVTFVNYAGARTNLVGRVGQTLLEVAQDHDYEFLDGTMIHTH